MFSLALILIIKILPLLRVTKVGTHPAKAVIDPVFWVIITKEEALWTNANDLIYVHRCRCPVGWIHVSVSSNANTETKIP